MTAAESWAHLEQGEWWVDPSEVSTLRRMAKAQGLLLSTSRRRDMYGRLPENVTVCLVTPEEPTTIWRKP